MIVFDKVTKQFGDHKVLNKVNLTIDKGEFVSVIGPSGAGKSTIFHLLMGATKPDNGHIVIDGINMDEMDMDALQLYRRRVGMVWQNFKLLPKKTVFENVAFALEAIEEDEEEIFLRVPEILDQVGLKKMADKFPAQLSGGEKQRCAIARALIHNPNLIIADEPTGNLDPKTSQEIIEIFKDINDSGVTIILATHDIQMVDIIKKRVVVIDDGKVVRDKKKSTYLGV
jgi:cell division transport system ATP-binding protein